MERPLDQVFLVNFGQKGPDFEFGHFSTVKSPEFSICAKIDFFWSEWLQKRSECRLALKFLAETLIRPKRGRFWRFFGHFGRFWPYLEMDKSTGVRPGEIPIFLLNHIVYIQNYAWEVRVSLRGGKNFLGERDLFSEIFLLEKFAIFCTQKVQKWTVVLS